MNTQTAPKLLFRYFDPSENFTPKHEPFRLFIRREVETPDKLEVLNLETLTRQRRDDWRRMFYQLDERTGFTKDGKEIRYFVLDLPDPLRWKNLSAVTRRNLQLDYSPLAVIRVDEKGIEGIDPKGRTWFVPTVPTAEELAETFVATLAELPEQERRAFVDWHLNNPHEQHGPTHREFVEGVRKIYETDALFHGRNRPAVRRVLKKFIQGEGEILPEQQPVRENFAEEQPVSEKPLTAAQCLLIEYFKTGNFQPPRNTDKVEYCREITRKYRLNAVENKGAENVEKAMKRLEKKIIKHYLTEHEKRFFRADLERIKNFLLAEADVETAGKVETYLDQPFLN